ncbi:MAG: pyridoxine 5'-phosphate synthase [Rickettsiales bacterium]
MEKLRLGVNIDHVATLRNARGGAHPDPVAAALLAMHVGADGITAHLREDRRHIRDADMARLKAEVTLPLNFEMAATAEMLALALHINPNACCLVPENRAEKTTEGGLDVAGQQAALAEFVKPLKAAGIRVSLFIDPVAAQVEASHAVGADIVELHTGAYAETGGHGPEGGDTLRALQAAAAHAHRRDLEVHAGHGLTTANVGPIAAIPEIVELNIGHFLIGEAVFIGLEAAIRRMREAMDKSRQQTANS